MSSVQLLKVIFMSVNIHPLRFSLFIRKSIQRDCNYCSVSLLQKCLARAWCYHAPPVNRAWLPPSPKHPTCDLLPRRHIVTHSPGHRMVIYPVRIFVADEDLSSSQHYLFLNCHCTGLHVRNPPLYDGRSRPFLHNLVKLWFSEIISLSSFRNKSKIIITELCLFFSDYI